MSEETVLDLARTDAVAGAVDHIVISADEANKAAVIQLALISGDHPIADELIARSLRLVPVLQEHHRIRPMHRYLSQHPHCAGLALIIHNSDVMPGHGPAHDARLVRHDSRARRDDHIAFGLTVKLIDGQTKR